MLVVPDVVSLAQLALEIAVGGLLNGAKLHLFKSPLAPSRQSVLSDFIEADFTGYAVGAAITWGTPALDATGIPSVVGSSQQFSSTDPLTVGNTVYGYFVTDTAGTGFIYAEAFATPQIISMPHQAIVVVPKFSLVSQA